MVTRICKSKKNIQWPKDQGQKDKQRSTKHTHKTRDRVTRTTLKTRGEPIVLCKKPGDKS
jgi:hypothetical protein